MEILFSKLKFSYLNEYYMYNPESVQEIETCKLVLGFEKQADHLFSARWQDLVIITKKKRTCRIMDFAVPVDDGVKLKESEKKDKYEDLARGFFFKSVEHEGNGYTKFSWCS